jgi:tripartite ATP-independent transporter DctP family solute receptor
MFSTIAKFLLKSASVSVAAALALALWPSIGTAQTKLLIGHTGTPGNSVYVLFDEFAKRIDKYSNGTIKPEVHHSGELGGDDQLLQSLKLGTVDLASAATGNMGAMTKSLLWADLPYIFTSRASMEKVFSDPDISAKLAADIERDIGTKVLGYVQVGGYRMLENRRRALKVPADVKGIKFRTTASPLDVALIQAWGGLPSQVAWAETFTAVQQGVVDGLNLQPVWTSLNGFGQVIKYATRNNAVMTLHCVQMSKQAWDRLLPDQRAAVQKAMSEAIQVANKADAEDEAKYVDKLKTVGVAIYDPTPAELAEWRKTAMVVWDKHAGTMDQALLKRVESIQK